MGEAKRRGAQPQGRLRHVGKLNSDDGDFLLYEGAAGFAYAVPAPDVGALPDISAAKLVRDRAGRAVTVAELRLRTQATLGPSTS